MKRACIDIGSNSVLLLAVEISKKTNQITKEILNESLITSLGKDLDVNKMFLQESMDATYMALKKYKDLLEKNNFLIGEVVVTGTEASRVSTNASAFFKEVKKKLGFNVQIITSEKEAYYTAMGVASSLGEVEDEVIIMDIGGASTELIHVRNKPFKVLRSISLPVGSVRATDWREKNIFFEKMDEILKVDLSSFQTKTLVCVAGSMTAMASIYLGQMKYDENKIERLEIPFSSLKDFFGDLKKTSVLNLELLFPYLGKRAQMLAGGAEVAELIGDKLKIEKIKISTRGLRYGAVLFV